MVCLGGSNYSLSHPSRNLAALICEFNFDWRSTLIATKVRWCNKGVQYLDLSIHIMTRRFSLLQDICSHSQPHLSSSSSIDHDDYLHDHTHFGHLSMISQHIRLFYAYNDSYLFIIARYMFTLTTMEIFFFFFYCS